MELEFKQVELTELKATEEKGTFEGIASPYNNIDLGNDRVLPSVGVKNDGKRVPMLYQHDTHQPIGEMLLSNSKEGVKCQAKFFIDKDEDKNYLIPQAATAYLLAKKGILKLSIGYKTIDSEYVTEGTKSIRNLKDIDIKEVSCVTFPMNTDAKITSVKEEGAKQEGTETKAQGFNERIKLKQNRQLLWQLKDALGDIFYDILREEKTQVTDKINAMNTAIDEFAGQYKQVTSEILNASNTSQKSIIDEFEKKNNATPTKNGEEKQENEKDGIIEKETQEITNELKSLLGKFDIKGEDN